MLGTWVGVWMDEQMMDERGVRKVILHRNRVLENYPKIYRIVEHKILEGQLT